MEDVFYRYGKMTRCDIKQGLKMGKVLWECFVIDYDFFCFVEIQEKNPIAKG